MQRRFMQVFVLAIGVAGCASGRGIGRSPAERFGAAPRELETREQAVHALNRLGFGPRPGDVGRVEAMGVDRWIDRQLQPERIADPAVARLLGHYPSMALSTAELVQQFPPPALLLAQVRRRGDSTMSDEVRAEVRRNARQNRTFVGDILSLRVARAVTSERQLQEVLTDFWHNHFTVFIGKGQLRYSIPEYDRANIRPFVLGRFRDLLGAVAKSTAMLTYLDNAQSVADSGREVLAPRRAARGDRLAGRRLSDLPESARRRLPPGVQDMIATTDPADLGARRVAASAFLAQRRPRGLNENYARELLELHTLGVDGGYTQADVIDVARALTGWTIRPPRSGQGGFLFNPAAHDAEAKTVLGHRLLAGRGVEDGEEVLDLLARHPSTARFIARKLAIRLVSDTPPGALVERAAETFARTDGDLREVVRTIVTSPEFFSRAAYRSKLKSPFEVVVSALRALDARPDPTARTAAMVAQLGQPLFGHQAPNGWPEAATAWLTTGAILGRINFGMAVAEGRVPGARLQAWPPFNQLSSLPPRAQVDGIVDALLGGSASPETRAILESGNNPLLDRATRDSAMSDATLDDVQDAMTSAGGDEGRERRRRPPRQTPRTQPPLSGLAQMVGLALGSPEFQRR